MAQTVLQSVCHTTVARTVNARKGEKGVFRMILPCEALLQAGEGSDAGEGESAPPLLHQGFALPEKPRLVSVRRNRMGV